MLKLFSIGLTLAVILCACGAPSPSATPPPSAAAVPTEAETPPAAFVPSESAITAGSVKSLQRLVTLGGYEHNVTDVAFSPDGSHFAATGGNGRIFLYETGTWREIYSFKIHTTDLNSITFSPDGSLLASAEALWSIETGQVVLSLNASTETGHVAFSPDGSLLAIGTHPAQVNLWNPVSGEVLRSMDKPEGVLAFFSVSFSPDGRTLAGGSSNAVILWDVATGQVRSTLSLGDGSDFHQVVFSPDGKMLAGGGTGSAVAIWDPASGELLQRVWLTNGIYGLGFSPDGKILALASCNRVAQLWDVQNGTSLRSLVHADELMAVEFSPDGSLLAAGGYDNTVSIWGIPE